MQKKIALIIERSDVMLGGAERSVFELSGALAACGHHVDILAAKGQTDAKNIKILCGDSASERVSLKTFAKALKNYLAENKYDIIHSVLPLDFADIYQPRGGSYAETIAQNAASYGNNFFGTIKKITSFINLRRYSLLRAEKKLCRKQNGPIVAALSKYVAEQFKKHYRLEESRIKIICNGVRINKPAETSETDRFRSQILAKLNIKEADEPVFFLFVAHNFRLKGLGPLIKAFKAALANMQRPVFIIVAGKANTRKYRWLARKLGIYKHLFFLGNIRNIQTALAVCDVAVLPTYYDPASRFILEALAETKPVITTAFNGASDMFTSGRHGLVIDSPDNTQALSEALAYFTVTANIQNAHRAIEADNIKENISIRRAAAELDALYDSILEKRRST